MTANELKALYEKNDTKGGGFFFSRETMKHWGDSMPNYGVRSCQFIDSYGKPHDGWELYRKRPVGSEGLTSSAYFDKQGLLHLSVNEI